METAKSIEWFAANRAVKQSNFGQYKQTVSVKEEHNGNPYHRIIATITGKDEDSVNANAHIIAASKELLYALKGLLKAYTDLVNSGDIGHWDCEKDREVIAARSAIEKSFKGVSNGN